MNEQAYKPQSDMQAVWLNIGQLQGAMKAQEDRSGRNETDIAALAVSVNKRFDGVKLHLDEQDKKALIDKTEILKGQRNIEDILLAQKTRKGMAAWLLARVEFLIGAGLGFAGAVWGSHR